MCELLEKARENQGNISYYEVAKRLNVSTAHMNKWKKDLSKPNGLHTLKLADMAGVNIKEAIKLVEGGYIDIAISASIAVISGMLLSVITLSSQKPLLASILNSIHCILC